MKVYYDKLIYGVYNKHIIHSMVMYMDLCHLKFTIIFLNNYTHYILNELYTNYFQCTM